MRSDSKAVNALATGWLLALIGGLGMPACKSAAEREIASEVARIAYAVQGLREAANNEKSGPLERLRAEPCKTAPGCELQQLCVQGYGLQERVLKTTQTVREALREEERGAAKLSGASKQGALDLLQSSEQDLARAKQLLDQCVALEGRLAREYL